MIYKNVKFCQKQIVRISGLHQSENGYSVIENG